MPPNKRKFNNEKNNIFQKFETKETPLLNVSILHVGYQRTISVRKLMAVKLPSKLFSGVIQWRKNSDEILRLFRNYGDQDYLRAKITFSVI